MGHGIASGLSARLGEGMVNGLLTARLGLLTIDLVRPLPFHELPRPALNDLASTLLRPAETEGPAGVERQGPGKGQESGSKPIFSSFPGNLPLSPPPPT